MNTLQLTLFVLFFVTTNGFWYIKRPNSSRPVIYPSPGKRSLPDHQSDTITIDCSQPYSKLHSSVQKTKWILKCVYSESTQIDDDSSHSSDSSSTTDELPQTSRSSSQQDERSHNAATIDNSLKRLLLKLRHSGLIKK